LISVCGKFFGFRFSVSSSVALLVALGSLSLAACNQANGTPDTAPPSAPGSLTAAAVSATQINLSWAASVDNVAVTSYQVQRCQGSPCSEFSTIGSPTAMSFSDTGLTPATSYSYRVRALDAADNRSTFSNLATAATLAAPAKP
jgi:chitodextrinase